MFRRVHCKDCIRCRIGEDGHPICVTPNGITGFDEWEDCEEARSITGACSLFGKLFQPKYPDAEPEPVNMAEIVDAAHQTAKQKARNRKGDK